MNLWLWAAAGMMIALLPCLLAAWRGSAMQRLPALIAAGNVVMFILALLAEAEHRPPMFDVALAAALLAFSAGLVFARFLQRWL